jgi:hypothetical protein
MGQQMTETSEEGKKLARRLFWPILGGFVARRRPADC